MTRGAKNKGKTDFKTFRFWLLTKVLFGSKMIYESTYINCAKKWLET